MKITRQELSDLLDDLTAKIGEILADHSILADIAISRQHIKDAQAKIKRMKDSLDKEKEKAAELKQREKRREYLNKLRQSRQTAKRVTEAKQQERITDSKGRLIGWERPLSNGVVAFLDKTGRLVALERGNKTFDSQGRLVGSGRQGTCLLREISPFSQNKTTI